MSVTDSSTVLAVAPWAQSIVALDAEVRAAGWSAADVERLWRTHDLMEELFAGRYRGSGRPFINHLAGTAALALRYGGDPHEVCAGYAHAAYAQGEFGRLRRRTHRNREELRAVLGTEAEDLVAHYRFTWDGLAKRGDRDEVAALSPRKQQLLFLLIVNEIDDSYDWAVYDESWCLNSLRRLRAAAEFAELIRRERLAEDLRVLHSALAAHRDGEGPPTRPKRSHTVTNRSMRPRWSLAVARAGVSLLLSVKERFSG